MRVEIDTSELRSFAADLTNFPGQLRRHLRPVVSRGAGNIQRQMQANLQGSSNAGIRHVARTVTFNVMDDAGDSIGAEIGPTKPSGALANIAYFGTWKGGGTVADPVTALEAEVPRFEQALLDKVAEVWGH